MGKQRGYPLAPFPDLGGFILDPQRRPLVPTQSAISEPGLLAPRIQSP